jgi:hypothetical protein
MEKMGDSAGGIETHGRGSDTRVQETETRALTSESPRGE